MCIKSRCAYDMPILQVIRDLNLNNVCKLKRIIFCHSGMPCVVILVVSESLIGVFLSNFRKIAGLI